MAKLSPPNHLSGSVLAGWMGLSKWQTAYEVIETARNAEAGIEPAPLDSLAADVGTVAEPVILAHGLRLLGLDPDRMFNYHQDGQLAAKKHKDLELYYSDDGLYQVEQPVTIYSNESQGIYVMNQAGQVELDGLVILESKFTAMSKKPDDPPLYRGPIQLQAGMMCHQAKYGILFTCYFGRQLTAHIFELHDKTVERITEEVSRFEQHMSDGTWPDPVTVDEMVQHFREEAESEIELDPDLVDSALSIDDANQAIKDNQAMKDLHSQSLMAAMGNHSKARVIDPETGVEYKVSWPFRKTRAKPAEHCPSCNHELKAAVPESEARQKTVTVKRVKQ